MCKYVNMLICCYYLCRYKTKTAVASTSTGKIPLSFDYVICAEHFNTTAAASSSQAGDLFDVVEDLEDVNHANS